MYNSIHSNSDSPFSVLLVEDAEPVRKRLRGLIMETQGLLVTGETGVASEAKSLFDSLKPEAVLLDLALIDGSGIDVLRHIRRVGGRSVVIILSGYLEPETYNQCSQLGADFLFSKSNEFEQAIETLRALASRDIGFHKHSANERRSLARLAVSSPVGIHARPAAMLVKQAQTFDADIELSYNGNNVSAKSILGVLTLGATYGSKVTVTATGGDADEAIRSITDLFVCGFGESPSVGDKTKVMPTSKEGETILLVDDDDMFRESVKMILKKHGYRVVEASNGVEAVALLTANTGDIKAAILDVIMPEINGRETMSVLRRMSPTLPVLITSGDSESASVVNDAAMRFIEKPFGSKALLSALGKLLGKPQN